MSFLNVLIILHLLKNKLNFKLMKYLKDYLGLEIPIWMQSRKNLFLFFLFDFILFILIKTDLFTQIITKESILITFLLGLFWCLSSYIIGKYSYFKNKAYLISKVINLIKSNFFALTFIYLLDKVIVIYFPSFPSFSRDKIFLLGLISFFLQFFKLFIYKLIKKKQILYLSGSDDEIDYFENLTGEFQIIKNFKLIKFPENISNEFGKISVIIFNQNEKYKEINETYPELEIEKYNPFRWCEKYLNRIPSNYLTSEIYTKNDWIVDTDNFQWRLKRLGDISISVFIIIFSFPLIIVCSFLIWFEDGGPIFYSQIRTGVNGKEFKLTKLRTMKHKAEITGPVWATKYDKRITKIGAFLRRTRIDELPQLLSVFLGDMSLIGPRPERPEIEIKLKENIPHYELRNLIKPGLSGWAQVNYPYGASIKDSAIKLSYELFYIRNQSFLLDILIFLKTIKLIINMKGSVPKNNGN
tara:strand:+ start:2571 stop:3977 length:1407 start_codon:yes stop_codon:yes gene_type:complete